MDFPTVLLRDLVHLGNTLDLDGDDLTSPLHDLVAALQTAVPSYRGLCLSLVDNGSAVRLSYFLPSLDGDAVATSFCLPFDALGVDVSTESRIVFYALTPGAFVDLAADLSHALDVPTARSETAGGTDGASCSMPTSRPPLWCRESPDSMTHRRSTGPSGSCCIKATIRIGPTPNSGAGPPRPGWRHLPTPHDC